MTQQKNRKKEKGLMLCPYSKICIVSETCGCGKVHKEGKRCFLGCTPSFANYCKPQHLKDELFPPTKCKPIYKDMILGEFIKYKKRLKND